MYFLISKFVVHLGFQLSGRIHEVLLPKLMLLLLFLFCLFVFFFFTNRPFMMEHYFMLKKQFFYCILSNLSFGGLREADPSAISFVLYRERSPR